MDVHVGEISSEIAFSEGEMPLTEDQVEMITERVRRMLADEQHERTQQDEATSLRAEARPPTVGEQ